MKSPVRIMPRTLILESHYAVKTGDFARAEQTLRKWEDLQPSPGAGRGR